MEGSLDAIERSQRRTGDVASGMLYQSQVEFSTKTFIWAGNGQQGISHAAGGAGRANPPTLLAKATPARRGPEPRSIAPGNFIRRRILIGSPGPVALPFGNLRPFSVPSAFFDVQQTDAAMR
jgi:hypothetical protein